MFGKQAVKAAYLLGNGAIVYHREGSLLEVDDVMYVGDDAIAQRAGRVEQPLSLGNGGKVFVNTLAGTHDGTYLERVEDAFQLRTESCNLRIVIRLLTVDC